MKFSIATQMFALGALFMVASCGAEDVVVLDTNRDARMFRTPLARMAGYDYSDHFDVYVSTEIESNGMTMKMSADLKADSEMTVSNLSRGGQKMDFLLKDVAVDVNSFLFTMHCDSNNKAASSSPDCQALYDAVGFTETLVVDSEGNIVQVTGPDGSDLTEQVAPISSRLSGAKHLEHHSNIMTILPDHSVTPGDTWDDEFELDKLGTFSGVSKLEGYLNYENNDCAVFSLSGKLHMDLVELAEQLYLDPNDMPMTSADADITLTTYWDYTNQISRWSQMNITTAFDVQNPMDPTNPTLTHVPVDLCITTGTDITKMPEEKDTETEEEVEGSAAVAAPASTSTTTSSSASSTEAYKPYEPETAPALAKEKPAYVSESQKSSTSGGGGGRGFGFTTFMLLLVVVAGAAGYAFYTKQKSQNHYDSGMPIEMGSGTRPPVYSPLV